VVPILSYPERRQELENMGYAVYLTAEVLGEEFATTSRKFAEFFHLNEQP